MNLRTIGYFLILYHLHLSKLRFEKLWSLSKNFYSNHTMQSRKNLNRQWNVWPDYCLSTCQSLNKIERFWNSSSLKNQKKIPKVCLVGKSRFPRNSQKSVLVESVLLEFNCTCKGFAHALKVTLLISIPAASQSIRYGYPPKKMEMGQKTLTLSETGLKSGETLIVEGKSLENWPAVVETKPEPPRPVVEPGIR